MEFAFDIEKTAFWHFALILFTYRDFESGDKADFRIRTSANTVSSIGTMGYDSFLHIISFSISHLFPFGMENGFRNNELRSNEIAVYAYFVDSIDRNISI